MTVYRFALAAALLATSSGAAVAAPAKSCPATHPFTSAMTGLSGYRIFTGPDGDSHLEKVSYASKNYPFMKTGKAMTTTELVKSVSRPAMLVVAPANLLVEAKPAYSKEIILLLDGTSTITTKTETAQLSAGMFVVMDDKGATTGHGGSIGPCGYVGLAFFPD